MKIEFLSDAKKKRKQVVEIYSDILFPIYWSFNVRREHISNIPSEVEETNFP